MNLPTVESYFFAPDGRTPNNALPVVIYRQVATAADLAQQLQGMFQRNGWTNNWQDIILDRDHYHTTTHEVLGISRGELTLQLGGAGGQRVVVRAGDVLIIPAGVGHFSRGGTADYEVIGGYPDGRLWDMVYNEPAHYKAALETISQLPLPTSHPLLGAAGIPGWGDGR